MLNGTGIFYLASIPSTTQFWKQIHNTFSPELPRFVGKDTIPLGYAWDCDMLKRSGWRHGATGEAG